MKAPGHTDAEGEHDPRNSDRRKVPSLHRRHDVFRLLAVQAGGCKRVSVV